MNKFYKIYVCVMLLLIVLLLGTLVGGIIYADKHVSSEFNKAQDKINNLNQTLNGIKTDLDGIKSQSQSVPSSLSSL